MQDKMHLDPKGFISILNFCYFTHTTSTRSMESYQTIVSSINDKFPLICKQSELKIDFNSVNANNDIYHVDFICGMVDGDGSISFTSGATLMLRRKLPQNSLSQQGLKIIAYY